MITNFIHACLASGVACALSLLLVPPVRALMIRIGAVDMPDERRVNRVPIPRGGGLAVVVAFCGALAFAHFMWPELVASDKPFAGIMPAYFLACAVLVGIGFLDDRFNVSAPIKLGVQVLVALLMCWSGARLILPSAWGAFWASPWIYTPLTLAWYILVINAFNLIDGLDGLSSGLSIIALTGMIGVSYIVSPGTTPLIAILLVGALLGFLRYNYNPASIFLGDSGSLFLGLTIATITLLMRQGDTFLVSFGLPILFIGVPLIDTGLAILRRTVRRVLNKLTTSEKDEDTEMKAVMTADRLHLHHRILAAVRQNQRRAVWCIYGLAVCFVLLGFGTLANRTSTATLFLLGFFALAGVVVHMMADVELWDIGSLLSREGHRNGRKAIAVPFYILCDILFTLVLFWFVVFLLHRDLPTLSHLQWAKVYLAFAIPILLCLVFARAYTRIWGRSSRKDSLYIICAVMIGSGISHIGLSFFAMELNTRLLALHILWTMALPVPLLAVRLCKPAFLQYLAHVSNLRNKKLSGGNVATMERVLFYGAGVNLLFFLKLYEIDVTRNHPVALGILDDDLGLRGRIFYNLKILGPLERLNDEAFFESLKPTKIIVTTPSLRQERLETLRSFCKAHNLKLTESALIETNLLA